jgi:hypothetical protein
MYKTEELKEQSIKAINGTKREIKHDTKKKSFKVEIIDNSSSQ